MQQNAPPSDLAQLQARIAALEAELVLYGFKYGLTDQARRLLAGQLQDASGST